MKIYFFIISLFLILSACSDDDYTIDPAYEKAEITGVELYNRSMVSAYQSYDIEDIDSVSGSVVVRLKSGENITDMKMAVTISAGADIYPSLSVGFQDLSSPMTYTVTSPGKSVLKTWTITVL